MKYGHKRFKKVRVFAPLAYLAAILVAAACSSPQGSVNEAVDGIPVQEQTEIFAMDANAKMAPATGSPLREKQAGEAVPTGVSDTAGFVDAVDKPFNTEEYRRIVDNAFLDARKNPLSTFSIDVDTASYSNMRRYIANGSLPPPDAVRIEELVNYFPYSYARPSGDDPLSLDFAMSQAPWDSQHRLLRVALKAKEIAYKNLPPSNLVFLLDTSGSMSDENKLPLLKASLKVLVQNLRSVDSVSIVAYAGSAGLVLDSTKGDRKEEIVASFDRLEAGGSTAGGEGIVLAYDIAKKHFVKGGNNRVILCTDGDFNVGVSSDGELERLIEKKRAENVYLTVLGFGMGNYKDSKMEALADKGNGNYAYIDNLLEGKKVLGKEIWGNLFAVAKDVKIQIEFNPAKVREYRLIGYENRLLAAEDFNDDSKDAGEMGSGQNVTAFYEIVPADAAANAGRAGSTDDLAFQSNALIPSEDMLLFKLRYKVPGNGNEESKLVSKSLSEKTIMNAFETQGDDFRFASALIEFGMLLRDSPFKAKSSFEHVLTTARKSVGADADGYRAEFVNLVSQASSAKKDPNLD